MLALRVAVGMVSHVDLPLDDTLAAMARSASTEVLGATEKSVSVPAPTYTAPLRAESTGAEQQLPAERLHK